MKAGFLCKWSVSVLLCTLVSPILLGATTWRVGSDVNDLPTIQAAVDKAVDGDTVVLSPATYTGAGNWDVDLLGKAITIQSTDPLDPNTVARTVIDCAESQGKSHQGFYVVNCDGAVLSGLTITHGLALAGGAVYCQNSTLDLTYCRILDNAALPGDDMDANGGPGGGLYCDSSTVRVIGCLIRGNKAGDGAASKDRQAGAGGSGAGICGVRSEITVESSVITENMAGVGGDSDQAQAGNGGDGGGLFGDSIRLIDSTVSLNTAGVGGQGTPSGRGGWGGGICAEMATVDRATIEANRAGDGGMVVTTAKEVSSLGGDGGGIYSDRLDIANSLITGNRSGRGYGVDAAGSIAQGNGGGIWYAAGTVRQCTIAGNVVYGANAGAGLFCTADTKVTGSILYGNTPDQLAGYDLGNVTYCNSKTPADSNGLAFEPPLFVQDGKWVNAKDLTTAAEPNDPNAVWVQGDYHLQITSPLLDAGDPNYVPAADEKDLDGHARLVDAAIDLGAYESPQALVPLYWFQSPTPGKNFYTISAEEKTRVTQRYPDFWTFEGVACHVYSRASEPNLMPVYRFWSGRYLSHFYTLNEEEKNKVVKLYSSTWEYEGVAFYAYPEGRQPAGAIPIYRFWSNTLGGHSYTTDEAEKDRRIKESPQVWSYEGVAWYAYADSQPGTGEPNANADANADANANANVGAGEYEFSGGASEAVCILSLKDVVDGKEVPIDHPDIAYIADTGYMKMDVDLGAMKTTLQELLWQSTFQPHTATIGSDEDAVQIPIILNSSVMFWGQTLRGPFDIDSKTLTFPTTASGALPGTNDETFTLSGTITLDGSKLQIGLVQRATGFATGKAGTFDTAAVPEGLSVCMDGTFQWSEGQQDLLIERTVRGNRVQLYVVSSQIQTTGVWQGRKASK